MTDKTTGFTNAIARFIVNTEDREIPQKVREHAKVAFMDWIGVTMGGKEDPLVKKLIHYADLMGGNEQATILGHGLKKSVSQAALINGGASHALDYDDTLTLFLGHPSVTLFPSLLALAEWKGKSGPDFLTAYIIGLKAGATIGACAGIEHYMSGWHATSTLGHFASAAACARVMGLNEQQTTYALGIAGTQACGLKRVFGTMCKPFHAGRSSQAGLMAALLAQDDFTSVEDILEGTHGFFQVLKGQVNDKVVETLGKTWDIENLAQKYHASCHATHSPIEAVSSILEKEGLSTDEIVSIEIHSSQLALDAAGNMAPKTGLEGKFSIPYCVANGILRGNTGMQAFTDEKVNDPEVASFMEKILVSLDSGIEALEANVTVKTAGGREFSGFSDILKQIPDLEIKRSKIKRKFRDLCGPVLGEAKTEDLMESILSLEEVGSIGSLVDKATK
ncbi:MAG: MmgE/PrpD family protein [Desulfatiglans sp.]|nr:MmgE/PrpD family protein [Desulfatiglans sp.]